CDLACSLIYAPVCGSDGKTYPSECSMEATACIDEVVITKVHDGPCETKCSAACTKEYNPQCGTDGVTYANPCTLEYAKCKSDGEITFDHAGPCKPKCPTVCTLEYNPQCGTDGRTYGNPCQLKVAECESDGRITLDHPGECDACSLKKVVGPCRGAFRRYYFDSVSGKCEEFVYGGCGGNDNNFKTLDACQKRCMEE
uniref:Four-domain proteases inhibitor n=1 Tax=Melithaea caledonica TaxID=156534 RepID=MCPI_MELCP|nr:RecName: Full=Four-domain proteases inhibitor; AltName: Full=McaPI [Melithaea caledonica]